MTIAFLGAGNIARAIMGGLIDNGHDPTTIFAADPSATCREAASALGVHALEDNNRAIAEAGLVMLCVKPDVVPDLLENVTADTSGKLFLSVAAGVSVSAMAASLPRGAAIVRAMPNTPALVQAGMTALFAGGPVTEDQRNEAESIMSAVGETLWVEKEEELDAVTAVSGSGPAYFFLLMEAMIDAARAEGLTNEVAKKLVLQTALGAARMAMGNTLEPAELRRQVTSPGGTTQAAIEQLEARGLQVAVSEAIAAARLRSVALSGGG